MRSCGFFAVFVSVLLFACGSDSDGEGSETGTAPGEQVDEERPTAGDGPGGPMLGCSSVSSCASNEYCAEDGTCQPKLKMVGLTASVAFRYICRPRFNEEKLPCAKYRFTFVIHNDSRDPAVRLEGLSFDIDGGQEMATTQFCDGFQWAVPEQSQSELIDVIFRSDGGAFDGGKPAFSIPCNDSFQSPEISEVVEAALYEGTARFSANIRLASGTLVTVEDEVQLD